MNDQVKKKIRLIIPKVFIRIYKKIKNIFRKPIENRVMEADLSPNNQDLNLYWDSKYAEVLDNWGKDNVWNEIQLLLSSLNGKVLDIACGTALTIT